MKSRDQGLDRLHSHFSRDNVEHDDGSRVAFLVREQGLEAASEPGSHSPVLVPLCLIAVSSPFADQY